jgi:hypothetical protein
VLLLLRFCFCCCPSAESPSFFFPHLTLDTRSQPPARSTMATRSQVTCHSEWSGHCITLLCITRGKPYREPIHSPRHASWKTRCGCARSAPPTHTDIAHIVRIHYSGPWVRSQLPDLGKTPSCKYGITQLGVGQEDGRRGALLEHFTAGHNAGSWSVQAHLSNWTILCLGESGDVLPCR